MAKKRSAKPAKKKKSGLTKRQAEKQLQAQMERVTEVDLENVLGRSDELQQKMRDDPKLKRFLADSRIFFEMAHDYYRGRYREVPYWSIAAIVAALIYILSPVDLLPEVLPVVGVMDDVAVFAVCLTLVRADVERYREWRDQLSLTDDSDSAQS